MVAKKKQADPKTIGPLDGHTMLPSEAVFAFASWLTTRTQGVTIGRRHNAAIVAQLVQQYADSQGWQDPRPRWTNAIK